MKKVLKRAVLCGMAAVMLVSSAGCRDRKGQKEDSEKTKISISFWEPSINKEIENALGNVKAEYEKLKPDVEVEIIAQPVSGYQEWIKAQIVADNMPDIESNYSNVLEQQYLVNMILDIKEEYSKPTPYSDGKVWKDVFIPSAMQRVHSNKYEPSYAVPFFNVGTAMYYNKDIYKKLGLSVPETWDEFMANCKKIGESNMTPIAFAGQGETAQQFLVQQVSMGLCGQRFLADKNINFNGDNSVGNNEIVKAIETGYFNYETNKEYRQLFIDIMDKVEEYISYCPNASGLDESAAKSLFLSGMAAHLYSGSWDMQSILFNEGLNFEVGTFAFPRFTKQNGKWAGSGVSYDSTQPVGITKTAGKTKEKKAAAIDFLQYLTSDKVYKKFIDEAYQIPVLNDVKPADAFSGFINNGKYPATGLFHFGSKKNDVNAWQIGSAIISGEKVEFNDALFKKLDDAMKAGADELKEQYGYNRENDYKIGELLLSGGEFVPETD